ncbi:DUF3320 domain-containing protein [Lysobacter sp. 2RAF19]
MSGFDGVEEVAWPEVSPFREAGSIDQKIERARTELLDLSTRNRLLHTPRGGRAKTVEVVGELARVMYQTLVGDGKRFTFAPGRVQADLEAQEEAVPSESADPELVAQPDEELDETGRRPSQWDNKLNTRMTSAGLQKRLLDLAIDARTLEEEQGVNILYLAIGFLRWRATSTPDQDRFGPLVLLPVRLERSNAGEKFHLKWSGEDPQTNLSLQLYLRREFGMKLPDITDVESFDIQQYLEEVAALVAGRPSWGVLADDAVLGLYSFAKFMMYRDLDAQQWQARGGFNALPSLRGVVADGFPNARLSDENIRIDELIPPSQMVHVVDCDSSQALVVHDVQQGASILVQGPPGTGKSQTITNIIATAVNANKRVLFVAEKMAALDVVKRRLDGANIGAACLELHSHKAQKRTLLEELNRTWLGAKPAHKDGAVVIAQLTQARDDLNAHADRLHAPLDPAKLTPFQVFGHLVRLRREGYTTATVDLESPARWSPSGLDERERLLRDLVQRIKDMGTPNRHPWSGVGIRGLMPNDRDRVVAIVSATSQQLGDWRGDAGELLSFLGLSALRHFADIHAAVARAELLLTSPQLGAAALTNAIWDDPVAIDAVLEELATAQRLRLALPEVAEPGALAVDWQPVVSALDSLLPTFVLGNELATLARNHTELDRLIGAATRLAQLLGEHGRLTLDSAAHIAAIGERAASIPAIDRQALVAHIWDIGVDTVDELIEAVEQVQQTKARLGGVFRDAAWSQNWEEARGYLATLGSSFLRFFNGKWRAANRKVRGQLLDPKLPATEALLHLDDLIGAQAAQRKIAERDRQGDEAFGGGWQRERSEVAFLRGVAEWMRSLRPLGSGVRERLADVADRELAAELGKRVGPLVDAIRSQLLPISEALIAADRRPWGEETILRRVRLDELRTRCAHWREVSNTCAMLAGPDRLTVAQATDAIARVRETKAALDALDQASPAGQAGLGLLWAEIDTDLSAVRTATRWMHDHGEVRAVAARNDDPKGALSKAKELAVAGSALADSLQSLFARLEFVGNDAVGVVPGTAPLDALATLLSRWHEHPESLPQWVAYQARAGEACDSGMRQLVDQLAAGDISPSAAIGTFKLAYYEAVLAAMVKREPVLAQFDGERQRLMVSQFEHLDEARMDYARYQVQAAHHGKIPSRAGATGPTALLLGEMAKKRGHLPIRQLMSKCGPTVQALKPVFMMSPLSVAQFLPPGEVEFDLLVIDEASQVQPVDALGAIARAKQLVIVGDERQLPPTRFFAKVVGEADENKDTDDTEAGDVESVLGLCRARGLPDRMLRWHYRSRHESLIAVSNSQFYENKLLIVPSPYTGEAGLGLQFHHHPNTVYDRGGTSTNVEEAKIVARAVIQHALERPHLSLGVAAFSTQQRRAVFDQVELLRRQHPEAEGFFAAHPNEPFFVKSLENIQGDERDVIYISVGYGRDSQNRMTMNFGPLGKQGGERRLNVLISRAKSRCEVFSSITDEDINLEGTQARGTVAFKLFLHYARTKRLGIDQHEQAIVAHQVFEEEVAAALRARGYTLDTNVGIAGLYIDIAIADPRRPGRYALGIACDGAWYGKASSARDRDRLRDKALRDKGWTMHRIWVAEWFQRPQAELERAVAAIEHALAESEDVANPLMQRRPVPVEIETVEGDVFDEVGLIPSDLKTTRDGVPYEEASFRVPSNHYELHLLPADKMADVVYDVVAIEGPIHRAEVVARARDLWGLQRAGSRIQTAVEAGIARALGQRRIERSHEDFLALPQQVISVRDRSGVFSTTLRRPDYLPPQELDAAIVDIVNANHGATVPELVLHVSRQLGYKSTSVQLRSVIEDRVDAVVRAAKVRFENNMIVPLQR